MSDFTSIKSFSTKMFVKRLLNKAINDLKFEQTTNMNESRTDFVSKISNLNIKTNTTAERQQPTSLRFSNFTVPFLHVDQNYVKKYKVFNKTL